MVTDCTGSVFRMPRILQCIVLFVYSSDAICLKRGTAGVISALSLMSCSQSYWVFIAFGEQGLSLPQIITISVHFKEYNNCHKSGNQRSKES